ncbi:type VI secretion system baseplate subunit TssG [Labrenzia sp. R4_1]|uniref:type VI secretion system baseplate subunit TssG n=1 Tax=Labrenzia sp. R4_1 TaxID=2821106 RepID=UPI001ADB6818|nr:type VI secretion system baseplate subunit TssG [Labrenzia sp. R4_1]MBO9424560.1 type VI secretion system baseplate subunit TssG [Labrenzia sp. R4_1]
MTEVVEATEKHKALAGHLAHSQFFQLVYLIGLMHADVNKMGPGHAPKDEPIQFRATRSLSFGASDVSEISYDEARDKFDIRVNFLGLYGPASPLPPNVTERIIESDENPSSLEDLLDLFNHRLTILLYQIWRRSRHYIRFEDHGLDATSKCFLALCGFPIEDRAEIGSVARSALLPHVGLMSLYSNSAEAVASVLSSFFKVPCDIIEYVNRHVVMGEESQISLGVRNTLLGGDMVLGEEVEDDLGKFTVRMGPAPYEKLKPFMPGGERHPEIAELLAMVMRDPLDWDLQFVFKEDTVTAGQVGDIRLGVSLWLDAEEDSQLENPVQLTGLPLGSGPDYTGELEHATPDASGHVPGTGPAEIQSNGLMVS